MDYILTQRVGEVEEEHSFVDLTIDEWLVIRGAFLEETKEDRHTTTPIKVFDIPAALKTSGRKAAGTTAPVYGGLE